MKYTFTFLFLIFFSFSTLVAQQSFFPKTLIDDSFGVDKPIETKVADADSDGDLDIFLLSFSSTDLVWIPNLDGNGNYGVRNQISVANITAYFDVGDIDGDGHVDIVRGNSGSDRIEWHSNDGSGNFGAANSVDSDFNNPKTLILSDIDGDNDLDIFAHSQVSSNKFGWFENLDGLGNFSTFTEIGTDISNGFFEVEYYAVDIDGDSDIDLLVANGASSSVFWFENLDGSGSYGTSNIIASSLSTINSALVTDIDGDLDLDVILSLDSGSSSAADNIVAYENIDGNGTFGSQTTVTQQIDGAQHIHSDDLDNDGDQDLLIADTDNLRYIWLSNDGTGNFSNPNIFEDYVFLPSHIATADIDNNGTVDIIGTSNYEDTVSIFKNTDGQVTLDGPIHINSVNEGRSITVMADIDNDGFNDIISASSQDDKVSWYKSIDGLGTFGQQNVLVGNALFVDKLKVIDFDKDGDLDITFGYDQFVFLVENLDGNGTFSQAEAIHVGGGDYKTILFMDVDNDLDIDLVTLTFSSWLRWQSNNDGLLAGETNISSNTNIKQIHKIDLNADGFMDLVGSGLANDKLIWFPNLGNGTFGAFQEIGTSQEEIGNVGLQAADIDGDGDLDIVSGSENEETVLWYENLDGLGSFGDANLVASNIKINRSLAVFDADLDGDADIIVIDTDLDIAYFIEHIDGNGSFANPAVLFSTNGIGTSGLNFGDLNGDFLQDLLPSDLDIDRILWYENLGVLNNVITGNITLDLESNGCDSSDLDIDNLLITASNDTYSFSTVTDINGGFTIGVTQGEYTTQITSALPDYYGSNPESHFSDFVGIENIDVKDFCLVPVQAVDDISVMLFPITEARPGFEAEYELVFRNSGTSVISGNIELNYDDIRLDYLNSDQTIATSTYGQITFDYLDLLPFETRTIQITFQVETPPTAVNDDILVFVSNIEPSVNDIFPDDNIFEFQQTLVGSYDPNDIRVLEGPEVYIYDSHKYLNYIIRFQNTGTASAINVLVTNELHPNLDWNSFSLLNTSHDVEVEIEDGNDVKFIFNNIYLPDETTDPAGSNGYIQYKIKPVSTVNIGDQVTNEAKIFFDFNPFIQTNTTVTTFIEALSVDELLPNNPKIFPNPVKAELHLKNITDYNIMSLNNILGEEILRKNILHNLMTLNLDKIPAGIYILVLRSDTGQIVSKKIIKE